MLIAHCLGQRSAELYHHYVGGPVCLVLGRAAGVEFLTSPGLPWLVRKTESARSWRHFPRLSLPPFALGPLLCIPALSARPVLLG